MKPPHFRRVGRGSIEASFCDPPSVIYVNSSVFRLIDRREAEVSRLSVWETIHPYFFGELSKAGIPELALYCL